MKKGFDITPTRTHRFVPCPTTPTIRSCRRVQRLRSRCLPAMDDSLSSGFERSPSLLVDSSPTPDWPALEPISRIHAVGSDFEIVTRGDFDVLTNNI
ncbi:hypothetical protein SAMD00023353_4700330 [Rosellinia necatrix]|uniref:Uncharacterized protein n=1 Tax=Rosellinia necatrix TaxID=77044 RepID=A0A1W2TQP3_ROSNE|nr:hypothetical protein SAMD00023353_4700330 [Rosellinia necatrix]